MSTHDVEVTWVGGHYFRFSYRYYLCRRCPAKRRVTIDGKTGEMTYDSGWRTRPVPDGDWQPVQDCLRVVTP